MHSDAYINDLLQEVSAEETEDILSILSKGHFTTLGTQDEEINSGNEVCSIPHKSHVPKC